MGDTLSLEESRKLLALCKAGKLYQVEEWIRQGKSIRVHPKSRDEPLHATLRKGFFSLIELLARHTESQPMKDDVLLQAVRLQHFDMVRMAPSRCRSSLGFWEDRMSVRRPCCKSW